jgi:hypothetical protein
MRRLVVLILCGVTLSGCFPIHGLARCGTVGSLIDSRTGTPIPGAVVTVGRQHPVSVQTAADGRFVVPAQREWFLFLLAPVPQDPPLDVVSPTLSVVHPGYEPRVVNLREFPLEDGEAKVGTLNMTSIGR